MENICPQVPENFLKKVLDKQFDLVYKENNFKTANHRRGSKAASASTESFPQLRGKREAGQQMNEQEQQSKEPIRSDMIVRDVILAHPDAAEVLMRVGMGCISCPAALMENLGDACMVHGLDGEEVVKYLNQELNLPQAD